MTRPTVGPRSIHPTIDSPRQRQLANGEQRVRPTQRMRDIHGLDVNESQARTGIRRSQLPADLSLRLIDPFPVVDQEARYFPSQASATDIG